MLTYTIPTDFFNEKIKNELNKKYNLESDQIKWKIRNLFKDIPKTF